MKRKIILGVTALAVLILAGWLIHSCASSKNSFVYSGTVETREIQIGSKVGGRVLFRAISRIISATYYIQILRGVILRGAGFPDLWINALVLTLMGCTTVLLAARQFVNQRGH